MTAGLFPEPEHIGSPTPEPDTSTPGERRRARMDQAIALGRHPLSVPLRTDLRLHADRTRTCGTCVHRQQQHGGAKSYPKCMAHPYTATRSAASFERGQPHVRDDGRVEFTEYPRATHGESTDVRKSWPACVDHEPDGTAVVTP